MEKIYTILCVYLLNISFLSAQGGYIINDRVTVVKNTIAGDYAMFNNGSNNNFGSQNFGSFSSAAGNSLIMKMPYFESINPCIIISASLDYRIYLESTTPPAFSNIDLTVNTVSLSPATFICTNTSNSIDILSQAPTIGNYKIDIVFRYNITKDGMFCTQNYFSNIHTTNFSVSSPPLAVEMSTFTARKQSNKEIAILWKTGQEKANKSFNIERSSDGLSFSNIGSLQGAENSVVEKTYNFTDAAPLQGVNYYRLKSVDAQGMETISKIVSVNFSDKLNNKLQIYPNPAQSALQVELISDEEASKTVQIFDLAGRMILSQNAVLTKGLNNITVDVNTLSSGTYLVKMGNEMSRFVKL
jgi:Secretion system C-terminal sorting domain